MNSSLAKFVFLCFLVVSCNNQETTRDIEDKNIDSEKNKTNPNRDMVGDPDGFTNNFIVAELNKLFKKPLDSYPLLNSEMINFGKSGLVYRIGLEEPFTGRLEDKSTDGVIRFQASFLEGLPHGRHLRWSEKGILSMETIFNQGKLDGVKKKWWPSGVLKEQEYWQGGVYRGRTIWDEKGRQIKQEWAKKH